MAPHQAIIKWNISPPKKAPNIEIMTNKNSATNNVPPITVKSNFVCNANIVSPTATAAVTRTANTTYENYNIEIVIVSVLTDVP